ncbi:MAG TPA: S53 family peptidase [Jatrophihabitans sp.]|jgi:subtilase family serine protease
MSRAARFTSAVAVVALAVSTAVAAGPAGASSASTATVRLAGDVVPNLSTYRDLGPTSPTRHVQVDIAIARPHPQAERAFYAALYTRGSGQYHQFLTPAQFDRRFGVEASRFAAVRSFATAHGLTVSRATGSRDLLVLDGTVAQVQRTFDVAIHNVRSQGHTYYANTAGPRVPAGLGIAGVLGLNDKLGMHLFHNGPANPLRNASHGVTPAQDQCQAGTCVGLTTPQDLWSIYQQPGGATANPIGNHTVDFGQGQHMAVFGEGQTAPVITNLRTFERLHKLPRVPMTIVHTDGSKVAYTDNAGEVEWDLDTQSSTGMAPDVLGETLYFGHDLSDQSVLNVFNTWADDPNGPLQANASYGECEENPVGDQLASTPAAFSAGQMFTVSSEAALAKANMEGRTLFSSAGDTGSSCPVVPAATLNGLTNSVVPIVNYPASSPHAVDVGGTVLYGTDAKSPRRALEYSWTYTGGGTSFLFAKPSYQDGITQIAGICADSPGGGTGNVGKPCRGAPDVAAQSGDIASNGYGIVAQGQTNYPGGGTSLSSPLWMGMWTRVQAAARSAKGLGFANPTLYKQFAGTHSAQEFFDIGGGPTSPPAGNGYYVSTPGWDYTSGMGSPNVANLARYINGSTTPKHPVLPAQAPVGSTSRPGACTPLFTDAAGDDSYPLGTSSGGNPQLDVLAGTIDTSPDGKTLRVLTTIKNLSTSAASPAGGGNEYYSLWTYKGTTYFADAEVDATGAVTYHDGTVAGSQYTTAHTVTGHFGSGRNGVVEVDVPVADVGSPPVGAHLTAPGAQTKVLVGTAQTGGLIEAADSAGPKYDYVVGQSCGS